MKEKFNQYTKLKDVMKDSKSLYDFLCYKAKNHDSFKIYSEEYVIDSIIDENALYIGDGQDWNDLTDRKKLKTKNEKIFAKCFSFSTSENVAMWMLYGGVQRRGAMIDLRKEDINALLSTTEISLGRWVEKDSSNKNDNEKRFELIKSLNVEQSHINFELVDVLYVSRADNNGRIVLKRSDDRYETNEDVIKTLPSYVIKSYPWAYENEVRLIIKVDKKVIPKNATVVKIALTKCKQKYDSFRVYHAPYVEEKTKYSLSSLNGKINWDLCAKCNYKKSNSSKKN